MAKTAWAGAHASSQSIRLGTAAVVVYSVLLPVTRVYNIAAFPNAPIRTMLGLAALAVLLPAHVWLVLSAARGTWRGRQSVALAALVVFLVAMLPLEGVFWVGILNVAAALTLVVVRRPLSLFLFAVFVVAVPPMTIALDQPRWALYFMLSMLFTAFPLATGLWLVRVARELETARLELAEQAVAGERLRVDDELRTSVGARLGELATRADKVKMIIETDPSAATGDLRVLVDAARSTLAEARGVVGRYRESSLRSELETIATLLAAGGIETQLDLPPGGLTGSIDEGGRKVIHRAVGDLLSSRAGEVTITVSPGDGLVRVALRSGSDSWTTEVGVA